MTLQERDAILHRVLAKPGPVLVCLKMMATKLGLEDAHSEGSFAGRMKEALDWWEKDVAVAITDINSCALAGEHVVTEIEFAELMIDRLRTDPRYGWHKILIGDAN